MMLALLAVAIQGASPPPLPPAERLAAARAAGFRVQGKTVINECDVVADVLTVERHDLDADGAPEIIVTDGGACYGNGASMFVVLRRTGATLTNVLSAQGSMIVLKTRRGGWSDIRIGGPGFGRMPVARWTGARYEY